MSSDCDHDKSVKMVTDEDGNEKAVCIICDDVQVTTLDGDDE